MAVEGCNIGDWDGRWSHVQKFLERTGPFTHPDFEPSEEVREKIGQFCLLFMTSYYLVSNIYFFYLDIFPHFKSHYSFCWKHAKSWSLELGVLAVNY